MAEKKLNARVQHKHDIEENWLKATNFIPLEGELIIYDVDETHSSPRFKVGDGKTTVSLLPFNSSVAEGGGSVDGTYAYFEEDGSEYIESALPIDADSLGGLPASSYSTTEQIEAQYVKASIEEVEMGEVAMTKADIADKATLADKATESDNSSKLENKTINELFTMMFEVEHPVGSLYLSMSEIDDPNTKWNVFGITCGWELVKDVFLLGAGERYALGMTGGESTHTLTVDEIAGHFHTAYADFAGGKIYPLVSDSGVGESTVGAYFNTSAAASTTQTSKAAGSTSSGGDQPHNNMPPYLATNIWKRIS